RRSQHRLGRRGRGRRRARGRTPGARDAARQSDLHAPHTSQPREPRLLLRLRPGDAMTKTPAALPVVTALLMAMLSMLAARPCRAAGFLIYDISGSAMARASAVTADDEEPAAVWFNPANLAFMGGASASAGGVVITD